MKTLKKAAIPSLMFVYTLLVTIFTITACDNGSTATQNFIVSYDAGIGSGIPPTSQNLASGETIYLPGQGNMSAPSDQTFKGWRTNSQNYSAGDSFTVTGNTIFLAQWTSPDLEGKKDSVVFDPTSLQAKPVSASGTGTPIVLASYTDGTSNFYLVDVGHISDMYISTIAAVDYTGVPVDFTKTITNTTTYTTSLTQTISESIAFSTTLGVKVGIGAEFKAKIPFVGDFTAKASLEESWSATISQTGSKSTSNTATTATQYADSQTVKYQFGANDHPTGRYRYAVYGVCDVYFILKTSLDNQTLQGWETSVCARPNDYFVRSEYAANGVFTNEPTGTIDFDENFYKNLSSIPITDFKTSHSETRSVNGDRDIDNIGHSSKDETFEPDLPILRLKQFGYTKLRIDVSFDYRSETIWGGNLRLRIANWDKTSELGRAEFGHTYGLGSYTRTSFSKTVSIDATNSDAGEFTLLWSRVENDGLFVCGYGVGNRTITITALK
jgi:hypothetical protein